MSEKILIIGGSSGIGMATAQLALNKNYDVVIARERARNNSRNFAK